mmetsp:Transcript_80052/g.232422  ORF Transcript_80052/g.232422 Transcript_80052/m.232422 type:complete len:228 (+) Transcript_80052:75-758(+)
MAMSRAASSSFARFPTAGFVLLGAFVALASPADNVGELSVASARMGPLLVDEGDFAELSLLQPFVALRRKAASPPGAAGVSSQAKTETSPGASLPSNDRGAQSANVAAALVASTMETAGTSTGAANGPGAAIAIGGFVVVALGFFAFCLTWSSEPQQRSALDTRLFPGETRHNIAANPFLTVPGQELKGQGGPPTLPVQSGPGQPSGAAGDALSSNARGRTQRKICC